MDQGPGGTGGQVGQGPGGPGGQVGQRPGEQVVNVDQGARGVSGSCGQWGT